MNRVHGSSIVPSLSKVLRLLRLFLFFRPFLGLEFMPTILDAEPVHQVCRESNDKDSTDNSTGNRASIRITLGGSLSGVRRLIFRTRDARGRGTVVTCLDREGACLTLWTGRACGCEVGTLYASSEEGSKGGIYVWKKKKKNGLSA